MKTSLTIFNLFLILYMNSQTFSNAFCEDITSYVKITKLQNERNRFDIIFSENDTVNILGPMGDYELLCSVKDDNLINVLFKHSKEKNYNMIGLLSIVRSKSSWKLDVVYNPISLRYLGKENEIIGIQFTDMNSLLISYKLSNIEDVDRLYRITEYGIIEYDCFGKTVKQRDRIRNSLGKAKKNKYRPTN